MMGAEYPHTLAKLKSDLAWLLACRNGASYALPYSDSATEKLRNEIKRLQPDGLPRWCEPVKGKPTY